MKRLHLALLVLLLALLAAAVWWRRAAPPSSSPARPAPPRELTEIALPGAALLATVDFTALRSSVWGRLFLARLAELTERDQAGRNAQAKSCADEVLAKAERVVLTIPGEGSTSANLELALVAEGAFAAETTVSCADSLLRARGADPVRLALGEYQSLRDRRGRAELAVRDGGPLIVGEGSYFRELVDRSRGTSAPEPGPRERVHARLRAELGPAPVLLTWVLPPGWLERWLEDPEVARSPLAAVRAVALRARLVDSLTLNAVMVAADADSAQRIAQFITNLQEALASEIDALTATPGSRVVVKHYAERVELALELRALEAVNRWLPAPAAPSATGGQ